MSGDNTFGQLGLSPQELKRTMLHDTQAAQINAGNAPVPAHPHSLTSSVSNKNKNTTTTINNNKRDRVVSSTSSDNCVRHFTQLMSLAHIVKVIAGHNVSFAIDHRGVLYSWGEAQYGQLAHNDDGSRVDGNTLK